MVLKPTKAAVILLLVLSLLTALCACGGQTTENPSATDASSGAPTETTADPSATDASSGAPTETAQTDYSEAECLRFFESSVLPLIEKAPYAIHGFNGYACALPTAYTGGEPDEAYINLYWNDLLNAAQGMGSYRKYDDSFLSGLMGGDARSEAPFLTEADYAEIDRIEQAVADAGAHGELWTVLRDPAPLQDALDALFGKGRIDIKDVLNDYRSEGVPVSFVSENGMLLYLTIDGVGGDISTPHAVYKLKNFAVEDGKAVLTMEIFSFITLLDSPDYDIMQIQSARNEEEYRAKLENGVHTDSLPDSAAQKAFSGRPYYFENHIAAGSLTTEQCEALQTAGFDEIAQATDLDLSLLDAVNVTLYNTEDGLRLWDIGVADPASPAAP